MLRWRLLIGTFLVAGLIALCWADAQSERPGVFLAPLALFAALLATGEMLRLGRARDVRPQPFSVYLAMVAVINVGLIGAFRPGIGNLPQLGWLAGGLLAGLSIVLLAEMRRFDEPGGATERLAHAALTILYVGGLVGVIVQLRLVRVGDAWAGLTPLASMIAAVKLSDTCQYFVGKSLGKNKLAPKLSPGKTWEGTLGGIGLAVVIAAFVFPRLAAAAGSVATASPLKWALYALTVGIAGLLGDLGESLLKRDAGVKDSSDWLPGFGGVLDLLDSLLLASPVAYLWWASGALTSG